MGCVASKPEKPPPATERGTKRRAQQQQKKRTTDFSNLDDAESPVPVASSQPAQREALQTAVSLEAKKFSLNPIAGPPPVAPAHASPVQPAEQKPAAPVGPVTGTIDPGKKVTLRQTVNLAIQIAKQQREKIGKFRRDERHAVMELYEIMGLENDTPLAPQTELQQQLATYNFPPENMHMLRDVETVDETTLISILGPAEYKRRKNEGSVEAAPSRPQNGPAAPRRVGVSAETTRDLKSSATFFKSIPKTREQTQALTAVMRKTILFRGMDASELQMLFDAFEREAFHENTVIFEKGDEGDRFYLIESGRVQIVLTDDDGSEKGSVFLGADDTFGELGVMYGTPRAATVIAVLPTTTWWIDRDTYRGLLLMQTVKKRDRFTNFLKTVEIFSSIDEYERTRIADVLDVLEVAPGTVIVREGEPGDTFYMIEEGVVEVSIAARGVVGTLGPGKVFGELALLFDKPRQATVTALTAVRMCVLGRGNFVSYLGPFENMLRRNAEQYKRVLRSATEAV